MSSEEQNLQNQIDELKETVEQLIERIEQLEKGKVTNSGRLGA